MATAFTRTLRHLEREGFRRPICGAAIAAAVVGAWVAWGSLARVTVYEVSSQARLEVDRVVRPVETPISGRVVEWSMTLGKEVSAGEVLLRLDTGSEEYALREEREKLAALDPEVAALRAQESSVAQAREEEARAALAAVEEARARL